MAGPAALAVALVLLPGWVYWRMEASARTTRTALGEFFEVVAAGTLATGVTSLFLLSLPDQIRGLEVAGWLVEPRDLTAEYTRTHFERVSWSVATLVVCACAFAGLLAYLQRRLRQRPSTYVPNVPLWVAVFGDADRLVTVDLRDGRRVTGYLRGHSVDDDGTPAVYMAPPLRVETPAQSETRLLGNARSTEPQVQGFSEHSVAIPGSEIVAIWREFTDDD